LDTVTRNGYITQPAAHGYVPVKDKHNFANTEIENMGLFKAPAADYTHYSEAGEVADEVRREKGLY
jgi:hypothetical protein